ncbi:PREDICTED: triokinase/FMN cyclase-like isoform X2 [Polistes dominula]|uniref:Triokinase/FMN cyclase n=1 Tax=Polistes dominula TaxID=743375 RepID=A0ABM1JGA2_POLDO|nr:PREDICTED: triokinase/FMN cyclase-like isoform X2 [Polistes dominula]
MERPWKNSDEELENSILSFAKVHDGLVYYKKSKAILRRDFNDLVGKVKLVSGGASGNEPAFIGFVGPGMLTAAVCGQIFSAPSVGAILKIIKVVALDYSGVLLIVLNYPGHRINFGLAKLRAEGMGVNVKMLVVGDDVCIEAKAIEKRGLAGILFIIKIAGAMAENGENLETIYNVCNRIVNSGEIATMSIGMKLPFFSEENSRSRNKSSRNNSSDESSADEMKTGYGIHGELDGRSLGKRSFEDLVYVVMVRLIFTSISAPDNEEPPRRFPIDHNVAVLVNNLGASNQIECNLFTAEILKQLKNYNLTAKRVYIGHLMTSLDSFGFQVSLLNLSIYPDLIKYLDSPTLAPAWPKVLTAKMLGYEKDDYSLPNTLDYYESTVPYMKPKGPKLDDRSGEGLLTCILFACDALISCTEQLNRMDREFGDGDCGKTIARGADAIKDAIQMKKLRSTTNPFLIFTDISCIIEKEMGGVQGGLYSIFFYAVAKAFSEADDKITSRTWLNALTEGNKVISEFGQVSFGDRTMLDPLIAAQNELSSALDAKMHPIEAFGQAVKAAEKCAAQTLNVRAYRRRTNNFKFKNPDPGAHAIGIWMRASYEGVKLKFACQCGME